MFAHLSGLSLVVTNREEFCFALGNASDVAGGIDHDEEAAVEITQLLITAAARRLGDDVANPRRPRIARERI